MRKYRECYSIYVKKAGKKSARYIKSYTSLAEAEAEAIKIKTDDVEITIRQAYKTKRCVKDEIIRTI